MVSVEGTPLTASVLSPDGKRITALDALRGLAVIGIVPMNAIAFSMPPAAYFNPRAFGGDGPLETALWAISFLLIEDKFRTLFAMMFGAGVAMLLGKAREHPLRGHYARMLVLLAIAMVHAIMLANNDVLRSYAVAGMLLPLAAGWQVRTLLWAAGAIMAAQLAVSGWFAWDWLAYWYERASGAMVDPAAHLQAEQDYGYNPQAIAAAVERAGEGLGERMFRRLTQAPQQISFVIASLPSALAAMLVGVALWRSGLLAGQWEARRALTLGARCAAIAVPVLAGLAAWSITTGFDPIVTTANALVWSAPFDLLLGIGWAALAMALFGSAWRGTALVTRLAAAGRMALTNYLATSLIFAILFMGWGLGLFAEVSRGQALLLGLIPIAAMLLWSPPWLARFRQGPAEWLWRSLSSGTRLPFKR
ncbi:DUF418 domain-containing protein [Aurantiacibacter marinus]|uniref:DUF418 domain-containing protein n=1 Tax=Aurantiacibacter marinus TaxID=874156 RepID=A0A0H0XSJ4_9SPHN|nr:DUF418 domain-containing protein [Aurantiacibacter marinus]KLI64907.1 hypothetical protein AAV99_05240 [Aurantiacibacter marinus]